MNRQERMRVNQLVHILGHLKGSSATIPLQHAVSFLHIALSPGQTLTQLAQTTHAHIGTASRHVKALSGIGHGSQQPPLVAYGFGKDGRTKALLLTDAGRRLLGAVHASLSAMSPASGAVPAEGLPPVSDGDRKNPRSVTPDRIAWDPFGGC
jgi:DNA-binding MarR family transcriptional regulator